MTRRATTLLALVCALSIGVPAVAAASSDTPAAAISDCNANGQLTAHYSTDTLRQALAQMPADVREYTNCYDAIERQLLAQLKTESGTSTTPTTTSSSSSFLPTWLIVVLVVLALAAITFAALAFRRRSAEREEEEARAAAPEGAGESEGAGEPSSGAGEASGAGEPSGTGEHESAAGDPDAPTRVDEPAEGGPGPGGPPASGP
jgi:hypothetical protein